MKCDNIQWKLVLKLHCSTLIKLIACLRLSQCFPLIVSEYIQMTNLIYPAALMMKTVANRNVFHYEFPGALEGLSYDKYS